MGGAWMVSSEPKKGEINLQHPPPLGPKDPQRHINVLSFTLHAYIQKRGSREEMYLHFVKASLWLGHQQKGAIFIKLWRKSSSDLDFLTVFGPQF